MSDRITYHQIRQEVASHMMSDYLPDKWDEMSEEEQWEFVDENKWEPLEEWDTDFFMEVIEEQTQAWSNVLEKLGVKIR